MKVGSRRTVPFLGAGDSNKNLVAARQLGEEGSNLHCRDQNPMSYLLNDPRPSMRGSRTVDGSSLTMADVLFGSCEGTNPPNVTLGLAGAPATMHIHMGSLVKKRRKRMRKKKHKKMLRRTRYQRRNK